MLLMLTHNKLRIENTSKRDLIQAEKQSLLPKPGFRKSKSRYCNTGRWKVKHIPSEHLQSSKILVNVNFMHGKSLTHFTKDFLDAVLAN